MSKVLHKSATAYGMNGRVGNIVSRLLSDRKQVFLLESPIGESGKIIKNLNYRLSIMNCELRIDFFSYLRSKL